MKILALLRDPQFSPNSVQNDRAIMEAVAERLRHRGHEVTLLPEAQAPQAAPAPVIFTMGRLPQTLDWLDALPDEVRIINSIDGVDVCVRRGLVMEYMRTLGTPMPPEEGPDGYWLKFGGMSTQRENDVMFAANEEERQRCLDDFHRRGITYVETQAHVAGDLLKFYGVCGTGFFHHFYPTDTNHSKFGLERHNGPAHHYMFAYSRLRDEAERLARFCDTTVYGGDAIVRPDGSFVLIDFNDWPSFACCRSEAAEAIASLVD